MLKLSIYLTRRADLTHEQFVSYWNDKHTPLLADLPPGALEVSRYVQLLPTDDSIPGTVGAQYDGVAELWVDGPESAAAWFTSDAYEQHIAPDEENFLDREKTTFRFANENVVFG